MPVLQVAKKQGILNCMSNFCKHCGAKLNRPTAIFCATCGRPVAAAPSAGVRTQLASAPGGQVSPSYTGTIFLGNQAHLNQLPTFTMGRDASNALRLDHPTVSRQHARVQRTAQGHTVRDLSSSNGTFVNGQAVRGGVQLQVGDVLQVGPFKLVYSQTGFAHYSPNGNYRLDGISLRKVVTTVPFLSPRRWLPAQAAKIQKLILDDVTLSIFPREFVALVGGSGAGKSTLMNALTGFSPVQGQVLVNGDDLYTHFAAYRSSLGYVPQQDIIHGQLTVVKALDYAAKLRLPDLTGGEIRQRVDHVLAQVELTDHQDKQIARLSGGQRKRVSIAAELLADPGLFFLDEPTSGLDPGLERKMMHTLHQLADSGRTILLVTHATANISLCSHVAFMADGCLVFFGPPQDATRFFGSQDFAEIYNRLSHPLDTPENPVLPAHRPRFQRMTHANGGQPPTAAHFWAECYRASTYYQKHVAARIQSSGHGGQSVSPSPVSAKQRSSAPQQFWTLTQRYFTLVTRDWFSLFTLLAIMPLIGMLLLLMATPHDLVGKPMAVIQQEIQHELAEQRGVHPPGTAGDQFHATYLVAGSAQKLLFMMALAATLLGVFAAAYEIVDEEAIYRRERMVNLKIGPYLLSKQAVLGGFAFLQCLLLLVVVGSKVTYPDRGVFLPANFELYITLLLSTLAGISMGLAISAAVRSSGAVIYMILLVIFVQIIFSGAIFDLPKTALPISYLTTTRWTLEALGSTVDMAALRDSGVSCVAFEDDNTRRLFGPEKKPCAEGQMKQVAEYTFNVAYEHSLGHLLIRWLVLACFIGAFGALTYGLQYRKDAI